MQLVMAGNDTQGLRYGTIETPEKYYLEWKEAVDNPYENLLDFHLSRLCNKRRFLQLINEFVVFDAGVKRPAGTTSISGWRPPGAILPGVRAASSGIPRGRVRASPWSGWPNGSGRT